MSYRIVKNTSTMTPQSRSYLINKDTPNNVLHDCEGHPKKDTPNNVLHDSEGHSKKNTPHYVLRDCKGHPKLVSYLTVKVTTNRTTRVRSYLIVKVTTNRTIRIRSYLIVEDTMLQSAAVSLLRWWCRWLACHPLVSANRKAGPNYQQPAGYTSSHSASSA